MAARRLDAQRENAGMTFDIGGWNAIGILAALAILAGGILLAVYAVRRGLVHRDLDGTIEAEGGDGTMPATADAAAAPSRTLGLAGVTFLVGGIVLGAIALVGAPSGPTAAAPGKAPTDCAQAWAGCPQATANPRGSRTP